MSECYCAPEGTNEEGKPVAQRVTTVFNCDFCGNPIPRDERLTNRFTVGYHESLYQLDLCTQCFGEAGDFMSLVMRSASEIGIYREFRNTVELPKAERPVAKTRERSKFELAAARRWGIEVGLLDESCRGAVPKSVLEKYDEAAGDLWRKSARA